MDKNDIARNAATDAAKLLQERTNGDVPLMMAALNTIEAGLFAAATNNNISMIDSWNDTSRRSVARLAKIYCKADSPKEPHH